MQNHPNSYNPPSADFTLAMESYLKTLRKLRLPNTLVGQQISAEEFIENLKKVERTRIWFEIYLNILKQYQLESAAIREETRTHYQKMLKFAQDNPLIMTMGMVPKGWDLILELERKKAVYELEKIIKELEKLIVALSAKYHVLTVEISQLKKEIDDIEEQCHEAALNLYTSPKDPDESTEIDLAQIMALQPYLTEDESKHILKINHTSIINNFNHKIDENPNGVDRERIEKDMDLSIREKVQEGLKEYFGIHFLHVPEGIWKEAANQIEESSVEKIRTRIQVHENISSAAFITQATHEKDQKTNRLAEASHEKESIGELLCELENTVQSIKSQKNVILTQGASPIKAEVEKLQSTANDEKITPQQIKNVGAFIKKQSATPNLTTTETSTEKFTNVQLISNNETTRYEVKRTKAEKNDSTIRFDEKSSPTTIQNSETESTQNKRPVRAKKVMPGLSLTTVNNESKIDKPDVPKPEPANDSTFKLKH